eukprot:scaffold92820_cov51-Phaeocystis_antarctica.AAC.3
MTSTPPRKEFELRSARGATTPHTHTHTHTHNPHPHPHPHPHPPRFPTAPRCCPALAVSFPRGCGCGKCYLHLPGVISKTGTYQMAIVAEVRKRSPTPPQPNPN